MELYFNDSYVGEFNSWNEGYSAISDRRLKENIHVLEPLMEKVEAVKIRRYDFKQDITHKPQIGYIAQSLQKQFPEFVNEPNREGEGAKCYSVNCTGMRIVAIKAIQEQQKIIEDQQQAIKALQQINKEVLKKLKALEQE